MGSQDNGGSRPYRKGGACVSNPATRTYRELAKEYRESKGGVKKYSSVSIKDKFHSAAIDDDVDTTRLETVMDFAVEMDKLTIVDKAAPKMSSFINHTIHGVSSQATSSDFNSSILANNKGNVDGNSHMSNISEIISHIDRFKDSALPAQKEHYLILKCVREVIVENSKSVNRVHNNTDGDAGADASLNPVAYFATLMTLLSQLKDVEGKETALQSICHLLSLVVYVIESKSVLQSKYSEATGLLMEVTKTYMASTALVRSNIINLKQFTRELPSELNTAAPVIAVYKFILSMTLDPRPKIKQTARQAVRDLLFDQSSSCETSADDSEPLKPNPVFRVMIEEFITLKIGQYSSIYTSASTNQKLVVEVVQLINETIYLLSKDVVYVIAQNLIEWLKLDSSETKTPLYSCFISLFKNPYEGITGPLDINLVLQILLDLYSTKPQKNSSGNFYELDVNLWVETMLNGFLSVSIIMGNTPQLQTTHQFESSFALLPRMIDVIYGLVADPATPQTTVSQLESMLAHLLDHVISNHTPLISDLVRSSNEGKAGKGLGFLVAIVEKSSGDLLSVNHSKTWRFIMSTLTTVYKGLGRLATPLLDTAVVKVTGLYNNNSTNFGLKRELEEMTGTALFAMGARQFFTLFPLGLDLQAPQTKFDGCWTLPIALKYLGNTELAFYHEYFLTDIIPKLTTIKDKLCYSAKDTRINSKRKRELHHQYKLLLTQLWTLLINFCSYSVDCEVVFPLMARQLASYYDFSSSAHGSNNEMDNGDIDIHPIISLALVRLVETNYNVVHCPEKVERLDLGPLPSSISVYQAQRNLDAISAYTKHFLPVLFNAYLNSVTSRAQRILNAISKMALISGTGANNAFFKTIMTKILESQHARTQSQNEQMQIEQIENDQLESDQMENNQMENNQMEVDQMENKKKKLAAAQASNHFASQIGLLFELSYLIGPYVSLEMLNMYYKIVVPYLNDTNRLNQKKALKALRVACTANSVHSLDFFTEHVTEIVGLLNNTNNNNHHSHTHNLKHRFKLYYALADNLHGQNLSLIAHTLPEIILGNKDRNSKVRGLSFDILVKLGHVMHTAGLQNESYTFNNSATPTHASLEEYFKMVYAGLGGVSVKMMSATIIAITRLVQEFKTEITDQFTDHSIDRIVETVMLFARSNALEINRSILSFVRVFVIVGNKDLFVKWAPGIIGAIFNWPSAMLFQLKEPIKIILLRFLRILGFMEIEPLVPDAHKKYILKLDKDNAKELQDHRNKLAEKKRLRATKISPLLADMADVLADEVSSDDSNADDDDARDARDAVIYGEHDSNSSGNKDDDVWIHDDPEFNKILDFLSPNSVSSVVSNKAPAETTKKSRKLVSSEHTDYDPDTGKMIICSDTPSGSLELPPSARPKKRTHSAMQEGASSSTNNDYDADGSEDRFGESKKRAIFQANLSTAKAIANKSLAGQQTKTNAAKRPKNAENKKSGSKELDPYAYFPLDKKNLNKKVFSKKGASTPSHSFKKH